VDPSVGHGSRPQQESESGVVANDCSHHLLQHLHVPMRMEDLLRGRLGAFFDSCGVEWQSHPCGEFGWCLHASCCRACKCFCGSFVKCSSGLRRSVCRKLQARDHGIQKGLGTQVFQKCFGNLADRCAPIIFNVLGFICHTESLKVAICDF